MAKKRPAIEVLKEYEQGNERVLLVKDGKDFVVIKAKTVGHCVMKKCEYGNLTQMKAVFDTLVAELKKNENIMER